MPLTTTHKSTAAVPTRLDTYADFIDDDHDDIISIFGEEVLHNID